MSDYTIDHYHKGILPYLTDESNCREYFFMGLLSELTELEQAITHHDKLATPESHAAMMNEAGDCLYFLTLPGHLKHQRYLKAHMSAKMEWLSHRKQAVDYAFELTILRRGVRELTNYEAKAIRDPKKRPEYEAKQAIVMVDLVLCLCRLAKGIGESLQHLGKRNHSKLKDRFGRGVIVGNGDYR